MGKISKKGRKRTKGKKTKTTKTKPDRIIVQGKIKKEFCNCYDVEIANGMMVRGKRGGKLRQYHIDLYVGDKVEVELCPYDLETGRIIWVNKD